MPEPGIKSSEAVAVLGTAFMNLGATLTGTSEAVQIAIIAGFSLVACVFIWSRTRVKQNGGG